MVWGRPLRLAASRVRATRCRESAYSGADSGPLFGCFWQVIFAKSGDASGIFLCEECWCCVCWSISVEIDHGCDPLCCRFLFRWIKWSKFSKQRRGRCFLNFFWAFVRLVMCLIPWMRRTIFYHLVAATIPEDRLRSEERHPRWFLGSYDTELAECYKVRLCIDACAKKYNTVLYCAILVASCNQVLVKTVSYSATYNNISIKGKI